MSTHHTPNPKPCPFAAKVATDIATAPVEQRVFMMASRVGYTDLLKMMLAEGGAT